MLQALLKSYLLTNMVQYSRLHFLVMVVKSNGSDQD